MDRINADDIIVRVKMPCPLCNEIFKYKPVFRRHLKLKHTDEEAEKYLNKIKKEKIALRLNFLRLNLKT